MIFWTLIVLSVLAAFFAICALISLASSKQSAEDFFGTHEGRRAAYDLFVVLNVGWNNIKYDFDKKTIEFVYTHGYDGKVHYFKQSMRKVYEMHKQNQKTENKFNRDTIHQENKNSRCD
ncbi:translation initiation factor IF-2 [Pectobacterium phage POP12]|nr:translation initiation factor IF-2 [Pectobacterium phage POP12]